MTTDQRILRYLQVILLTLSITIVCLLANIPKIAQKLSENESDLAGRASQQNVVSLDATNNLSQEGYANNTMTKKGVTAIFRCTAFCPCPICCPGTSDGITANGHKIRPGERFVAADRRFAFGTMMTIPGYNEGRPVPVLDRGGAIKGNKLDVFFDDDPVTGKSGHQRAIEWGRQKLEVTIEK